MCRETLQTNYFVPGDGANINILGPNQPANHPHFPEDLRIERQDFLTAIKERIEQDPSLPIRAAYEAELMALPVHDRQNAPAFDEVRSGAYSLFRRVVIPKGHYSEKKTRVINPKGFYSEGSLFRKEHEDHYPEGSLFRKYFDGHYSEGSLFRK